MVGQQLQLLGETFSQEALFEGVSPSESKKPVEEKEQPLPKVYLVPAGVMRFGAWIDED